MIRRAFGRRSAHLAVALAAGLTFLGGASAAAAKSGAGRHPSRGPSVVPNPLHPDPLQPTGAVNNDTVASLNWSGYAVESPSKFTDVKGSWVQPSASCSGGKQYAAFWAGIDGYSSPSVEQLGTYSNCAGRSASYSAWIEMYPANPVDLPTSSYPVKPGDRLSAEVSVSGSSFTLSIKSSEGWTFSTVQSGSGLAQSSAELIAESPALCSKSSCHIAQLSNFGTVNFSGAAAAVSGGKDQPFGAFTYNNGPHEIVGVTKNGTVKMQPSALTGGSAFSVTWEHQ